MKTIKMISISRLSLLLLFAGVVCWSFSPITRDHVNELVDKYQQIDTLPFVPDTLNNWRMYTSYLLTESDSVRFEVILYNDSVVAHNWQSSFFVGNIPLSYSPNYNQSFEYYEPERTWLINILTDGKCYFRLISGKAPAGSRAIIPVQTRFKKS